MTGAGNVTPLRDMDTEKVRTPPYNVEAEQALLGALLIDNRSYDQVVGVLRSEEFGNSVHARIYEAIGKLIDKGAVANPVTLKAYFDHDGALADIGGAQYLGRLADAAVTIRNAEDYARAVHDLYMRRQLIVLGEDIVTAAYDVTIDHSASDILSDFDGKLIKIGERGDHDWVSMSTAVDRAIDAAERVYKANGQITGITTGLIDLDRRLGGLQGGDLIIVAGRPSMGKSALSSCIAEAAAREQKRCAVFSLEMTAEELAARMIAKETGISAERQRAGPIDQVEISNIAACRQNIAGLPLIIDDGLSTSVSQIRSLARRIKRRRGLDLAVVDHIGLMLSDRTRPENRTQELSAITRGLKMLAMDLGIPVIAVSQLNRGVEQREDKRPTLADLRESGSIEQDADVVIFVYREEYYLSRAEPKQRGGEKQETFNDRVAAWQEHLDRVHGIADLIIAKNRHGSCRTVKVHFDAVRTAFENLYQTP